MTEFAGVPVISVCVITYNHAAFIRDALEGIARQRTNFPFEVVVSDDGSTDGTVELCRSFGWRLPGLRVAAATSNRGALRNLLEALAMCRGRFVALCEGDDFWIDPDKLQLQFQALESRPDYSVCFHAAIVEYPDRHQEVWQPYGRRKVYDVSDLFKSWLMPTASVVFRNPIDYPPYVARATHGDLALFTYLARAGPIAYLDRIMSVYRKHPAGMMSTFVGVEFQRREVAFLLEMNQFFEGALRGPVNRRVGALLRSIAIQEAASGARRKALTALREALPFSLSDPLGCIRDASKVALHGVLPARLTSALRNPRQRLS